MTLKDAYDKYRAHGFIMLRTAKNQKFSNGDGAYTERENEPFSDKATGYAAIVPPEIIIVDNDHYKDNGESFALFLEDMGYAQNDIVPFAKTPSGGEHYAFINKYPSKRIGSKQGKDKRYPYLDVFTGFQSVIPCVGTVAFSKHLNGLGTYEWSDDNFEEDIILNRWNENFLDLFGMVERGDNLSEDYDDLSLAIKEDEMGDAEVVLMLERIPNKVLDYDGIYLPMGMALYDRYEGSARGLELFQQFCAKVEEGNDPEQNRKKWENGNFKGGQITFKRIRKMYKQLYFREAIAESSTADELQKVMDELKAIPSMVVDDKDLREQYAIQINNKFKDLKKEGKYESRVPQVPRIMTSITPEPPKPDVNTSSTTKLYLCDGKYYIQHGIDLFENIPLNVISKYLRSFGYDKGEIESIMDDVTAVRDIRRVPDYLIKEAVMFRLDNRGGNAPDLSQRYNPLASITLHEEDNAILHDFLHDVWAGKIDDIVKLIALTIKFKEQKLNRLMLVAPSNSGKSEVFKHLGFQKITMPRLVSGMRGDKGVGVQIVDGIRKTGLLLIDEANEPLTQDVKDMDGTLHLDQFGKGGTQALRLHFTGLTSTHKTATSYNSDELYQRFLQIELKRDEMVHTVTESQLFIDNSEKYSNVVQSYMLRRFNEWIHSNTSVEELKDIQAKYRLPINEVFTDTLLQISEEVIEVFQSGASNTGDILLHGGVYYIKRKSDLKNQIKMLIDQLHKTTSIDVGKYTERMFEHLLADSVGRSIKIDGIPVKYYRLNLSPYYEDMAQSIINDFENLEDEL